MQLDGVAVPMASMVAVPRALCASRMFSKCAISLRDFEDLKHKQGNDGMENVYVQGN